MDEQKEIEEMRIRFAKQMRLAYLIKHLSYDEALIKANFCITESSGLNVFDVSYVLAMMFDKTKEETLKDLLELRKKELCQS